MCGIGGVLVYPKKRTAWELAYIKELTKNIAAENQIRGSDSTGIALFNKNDHRVIKEPIRATQFIMTDTFNKFLNRGFSDDTKNVLIHTRMGTKGSEKNNDNNHPIVSRHWVGVHNGMISNDDKLFNTEKLFRLAQVDSEVIFRMLDKYASDGSLAGVKKVAETISGVFTFATVAKERRNEMWLVKCNNPVTLVYIPSLNVIAFASLKYFLTNAIHTTNIEFQFENYIDDSELNFIEPEAKTIMKFDTNIDSAEIQLAQEPAKFKESDDWGYGYGYDDSYYTGMETHDDWHKFYNAGYHTGKKYYDDEVLGKDSSTSNKSLESIIAQLSKEDALILAEALDYEWNKGYKAGRESADETVEQARGFAFEKGYTEGYIDAASEIHNPVVIEHGEETEEKAV